MFHWEAMHFVIVCATKGTAVIKNLYARVGRQQDIIHAYANQAIMAQV